MKDFISELLKLRKLDDAFWKQSFARLTVTPPMPKQAPPRLPDRGGVFLLEAHPRQSPILWLRGRPGRRRKPVANALFLLIKIHIIYARVAYPIQLYVKARQFNTTGGRTLSYPIREYWDTEPSIGTNNCPNTWSRDTFKL